MDHVGANRRHWNETADRWVAGGEQNWTLPEPTWGQWEIPESELRLLPADMEGLNALELGCGTGYVAAWMWQRGAAVTALDVSEKQLATAIRLARRHQASIGWIQADAEAVPLRDESFDFAISEYGAALWCEPRAWLGEAHRVLRPGGHLVFLSVTPLVALCSVTDGSLPVGTTLTRPYFGLYRMDWTRAEVDPGGVEFVPTVSDWFRVFAEVGFVGDDFGELRAPDTAEGEPFAVTAEWARQWPSEQVWRVQKP